MTGYFIWYTFIRYTCDHFSKQTCVCIWGHSIRYTFGPFLRYTMHLLKWPPTLLDTPVAILLGISVGIKNTTLLCIPVIT